jgi:hypothetical protein
MEIDNESRILYQKAAPDNSYKKKSSKVGDFFYGFFLALLLFFTASILYVFVISYGNFLTILEPVVLLLMIVFICRYYEKKDRRFVSIGIVSLGLLVILIFGSCIYSLNNADFSNMNTIRRIRQ